jgi:hypothetical protein
VSLRARLSVRRFITGAVVAVLLASMLAMAGSAAAPAQRRRGFGFGRFRGLPTNMPWLYDGRFVFCRLAFNNAPYGDGGGWGVDYPRADLNFPFRLGELTEAPISRDERGEPNHVVVTLTDPHLFDCPFVMMTEPGGAGFTDEEAGKLREYLEKGGFLWADDFWGEYAWQVWENEIRKALPSGEYPIVDLPRDHPIFNIQYLIKEIPQIPSINFWFGSGFQTSERGYDSAIPHVRAIMDHDHDDRVMVLMTHNTDFGDAFEREGEDRRYFDTFAAKGYGFGVNVYLYAMTH